MSRVPFKFKDGVPTPMPVMSPCRVTLSVGDDSNMDNIRGLPPLDADLTDKVMLFGAPAAPYFTKCTVSLADEPEDIRWVPRRTKPRDIAPRDLDNVIAKIGGGK